MRCAAALRSSHMSWCSVSRWSFPAVNAYTATVADNGKAISSFNAPGAALCRL